LLDIFILHLVCERNIIDISLTVRKFSVVFQRFDDIDLSLGSINDIDVLLPQVKKLEHIFKSFLNHC
jgi:hypothetical protein